MNEQLTLPMDCPPKRKRLSPILKWAGGKQSELIYIAPNLPAKIEGYYEPFVGGGAVYTAIDADRYHINDKSEELIALYRNLCGPNRDDFCASAEELDRNWSLISEMVKGNSEYLINLYRKYSSDSLENDELRKLLFDFVRVNADQCTQMFSARLNYNPTNFLEEIRINMVRKIIRMKDIERTKTALPDSDIMDNVEASLKSAFYMQVRHIYNNVERYQVGEADRSAIFLFVRCNAYSGMFRYNPSGGFNVPYGGIGYNGNSLQTKIDYYRSDDLQDLLRQTSIENLDFEDFLKGHVLTQNDFVFLDPPYDSEFSTYAKNEFNPSDQARLSRYLVEECPAKWMLVIKNTELIRYLYFDKNLHVRTFDKTYAVSFMNRNDKITEHLMITNY